MDSGSHKTLTGNKLRNLSSQESVRVNEDKYRESHKPSKANLFYTSSGISDRVGGRDSGTNGVKVDKSESGDNSYEIWCICRIIKPCRECQVQQERDKEEATTPQKCSDNKTDTDQDSNSSTPTPGSPKDTDKVNDIHRFAKEVTETLGDLLDDCSNGKCFKGGSDDNGYILKSAFTESFKDSAKAQLDNEVVRDENNRRSVYDNDKENVITNLNSDKDKESHTQKETAVNDLEGLLAKLDEISKKEDCGSSTERGDANNYKSLDFVPNMDTASVCSFDHFDFDTSFCSLKSTDMMMDQGDLADQLSMVQQMVLEMKTGFSTAMEELAKIQYGDQTLQQQLADNKKQCADEIDTVKQALMELKNDIQKLSGQIEEVMEVQRTLQEKVDAYQSDKNDIQKLSGQIEEVTQVQRTLQEKVDAYQSDKAILLDELERNGAITDQVRVRLSSTLHENNNNNNTTDLPEVAPMVHPYLNSLQNHHQSRDDQYNSDSSLTAAVSRSLNLTQALGEKCLQLDLSSTSSDEEENSRHSHSGTTRKSSKRKGSFQIKEENKGGNKKLPPHQQVLEEVQREEAVRDMVEAEREYCSQIWSLLEDYLNPLRDEDIVNRREINNMFPTYIPHMYEQHCIMLRKMEERLKKWKFSTVIGDIFARFTESQEDDGLNLYKEYINDFPTVINTMNKWFSHSPHFRELMQSQSLASSPVLSALLAPLQQVPKYSLLLKNLLKNTPVDHPDRYYLESSLNRLKAFLNTMNSDLEQAMQTINLNNQPISRSRDSARSRSSGSSAENNHLSRDSGVHSNEEERAKSPMTPNTTRRFVLQVLREKREQETRQSHGKMDFRPPSPHGRFGSHPDLTERHHVQDGRTSPHLSSLPQSKLFSSLSKLPLPKEKGKRSKSSRLHEAPRPVINTTYLRPLTPQLFPTSTSAYSFDSARRRDSHERPRHRPASAMEFTTSSVDTRDQYLELVANQAGLTFSPSHSTSSDHSRRELEMSLQKLLHETNNANTSFTEDMTHDEELEPESHGVYQKQFLASKERILNNGPDQPPGQSHNSQRKVKRKLPFNPKSAEHLNTQEDYGIYGDDDEDDDEDYHEENYEKSKVKPMQLLPDTHRPKIMVPRWRQNASPQPPSYGHAVEHVNKPQNAFTSEENLAASLAQSLLDGEKNQLSVSDIKVEPDQTDHKSRSSGSLKRKENSKKAKSPRRSPAKQSPNREGNKSLPHARSKSFDVSPSRPTELNLAQQNNLNQIPITQDPRISREQRNSVSKLTDVIAYTADCIEKSESLRVSSTANPEMQNKNRPTKSLPPTPRSGNPNIMSDEQGKIPLTEVDTGHSRLSDILSDDSLKVSSVDSDSSPTPVASHDDHIRNITPLSFAVSPNYSETKSPTNTDGVVQYFKNRDNLTSNTNSLTNEPPSKLPTFAHANKTSTPLTEERPLSPNNDVVKDNSGTYNKREIKRAVRDDFGKGSISPMNGDSSDTVTTDSESQPVTATKESVLKKVDKLRISFERQKQLSEERRQQSMLQSPNRELKSPTSQPYIQRQFNEISLANRKSADNTPSPTSGKPLVLKTFSMPNTNSHDKSGDQSDSQENSLSDSSDHKQGIYRKAANMRIASRYPESALGTKHKLERASSPTGRNSSPTNFTNQYEKFRNQVELPSHRGQTGRLLSPNRSSKDYSMIPQRSKSQTRSSAERERPKSTTDLERMAAIERENQDSDHSQLKSALKEPNTKIPVLKKAAAPQGISKSTEDISKMKKKSAFKTKLNNIFGRKKKKSKLYSTPYDPEQEYEHYVTEMIPEPFLREDDVFNFPLTPERRANSTSQILDSYHFESDSDSDEISAV